MEAQTDPLIKRSMQLCGTLLVCFANREAGAPRSHSNMCQGGCSTHHRQCSLHWTPALQNSSHWCDPWRSANSEVSLHSRASADCLLTWKQHLKLHCCHMAGNPHLKRCSLTLRLQWKCRKSWCTQWDLFHFQSHATQLELGKGSHHFKRPSKCITCLNKKIPITLSFSPINCRILPWTVHSLWSFTASSKSLQIQDTFFYLTSTE